MKRLIGFAAVLVALFLSNNIFAQDLTFELNGKKYEAAKNDLEGRYTYDQARAGCEGLVDPDDFNEDWFLPSKEELNAMYEQLHKKGVGGFANFFYWSFPEFEDDENLAWGQNFSSGYQGYGSKDGIYYVRCVRAL